MKKLILFFLFSCSIAIGQKNTKVDSKTSAITSEILGGFNFRSIGPAFMSGRISDIVIDPCNENKWYVSVGSGGVWKTENAGATWQSIFEGKGSYSIGCLALNPSNYNEIWVGTGENVGGRHVGYGDGIYKSADGGKSWQHMGLKSSEHISKIIIHPKNSQIIWVASQGPLWSSGGDRGVYKSIDGGKTWKKTLGEGEWVGATDLVVDPRNADVLYAATWQRHRTIAGYMGGGPGTAIYKSTDGGENWSKLSSGLPSSNLGKIGLAISPQQPDIVYAAIELDRRKGGVFKSVDQGASWNKMSDAVSGGTGPHYYQELYADPHQFDRIYLVSYMMFISDNGGKDFYTMNENNKHVDNHAIAFKKNDPNYLLVGTDGGVYESFDKTKSWKYVSNLPLTQFYKIAVDDQLPYYNVYGGTQDNSSQMGPSRTTNINGIRNADWSILLGGDGHQPATEPGNPNIIYAQWQQGNLVRHDRATGENVYIQPQPELGEKSERFNWDAPILVSPHKSSRIYFASQRLWKSDNRGDSWEVISPDLTTNTPRTQTPFFGKKQAWDNPWDVYAMSNYSSITNITESPKKEGLLYVGTDDGNLHVTEDGGKNWRRIPFSSLPGLPAQAFVNDVKADLHDENTVYAVFDNHKSGDFKAYVYKSNDKGKSWVLITKGIAERTITWRIVQDHVKKNLLFLGTEFGVYVSISNGDNWLKFSAGLPTISVRDIAIQKRENDLVLATFGRGIYILDDYSALRNLDEESVKKEAYITAPRKSYWYQQRSVLGEGGKASQGDSYFVAQNPDFGVQFTYYIANSLKSSKEKRKEQESEAIKAQKEVSIPDWAILEKEELEGDPKVMLAIYGASGELVRLIEASNGKGFQRVNWNLRRKAVGTITPENKDWKNEGPMVAPGKYQVQLLKIENQKCFELGEKVSFEIEPLPGLTPTIKGMTAEEVTAFWVKLDQAYSAVQLFNEQVKKEKRKVETMLKALTLSSKILADEFSVLSAFNSNFLTIENLISGSNIKQQIGEENEYPTVYHYLGVVSTGVGGSTYGPTPTHLKCMNAALSLLEKAKKELENVSAKLPEIEKKIRAAGVEIRLD
jgi:photosystem II stability/assembly factor-like uncharacterized protein